MRELLLDAREQGEEGSTGCTAGCATTNGEAHAYARFARSPP